MRLSGICLSINQGREEHFWYYDGLPLMCAQSVYDAKVVASMCVLDGEWRSLRRKQTLVWGFGGAGDLTNRMALRMAFQERHAGRRLESGFGWLAARQGRGHSGGVNPKGWVSSLTGDAQDGQIDRPTRRGCAGQGCGSPHRKEMRTVGWEIGSVPHILRTRS